MSFMDIFSFRSKRSLPAIRQAEMSECGLACMAMIASFYGQERDLASLRRQFDASLKGLTLKGLMEIADGMGFSSRPVRVELDALDKVRHPAVLHWNMSHFVVLERCDGRHMTIVDPAKGRQTLSLEAASPHFTGVALEVTPETTFERKDGVERVRIRDFWQNMRGLKRSLLQLFLLALILQAFALLTPLFTQVIMDGAIANRDIDLLTSVAAAFGLLIIAQAITGVVRQLVGLHLTTTLTLNMRGNLFRHLLRLPVSYFEKRHIGSIIERFGSLGPVEQLLSNTLVSAILDGLVAVTTVIVIFLYSWQLSLIVLAILVLNLIGTLVIFPIMRSLNEKEIEASGIEQTTFLEIIRAIPTIKAFGRESEREAVWRNTLADAINQGVRAARVGIWSGLGTGLLSGLGNVVVLFFGARMVIEGNLTIGMLLAFQIYQGQFVGKAQALIGSLFQLRMLGLHLERLADIAHADVEGDGVPSGRNDHRSLQGAIELRDVSYRYAKTEPYVLEGLDLEVEPGECLVIRGDSGSGKSTLLKIMTGLVEPTSGSLLFDDRSIADVGRTALRRQIGIVSQNDTLLSGTLAENISFFDPEQDMEHVKACARLAMIDMDIQSMPMRYDSLIGDMGSALSGGQQQRVLLARALYNLPRILILDEVTAHIDPDTTRHILTNLGRREITRIIVSHDELAELEIDRELWLDNGRLVEKSKRLKFTVDYNEIIQT